MKRLLLIVGLLIPTAAEAICGSAAVCQDTSTSLHGEVVLNGIRLTWSTDDEWSGFGWYTIRRYVSDPDESVFVATVSKAGQCGTNHDYDETYDNTGGPYIWTVEVWRSDNTRACAIDVDP